MSVLTASPISIAPAAAISVSLPSVSPSWTYTSWAQILPIAPIGMYIAGVVWAGGTATSTELDVDIGVGVSGAEVSLGHSIRLSIQNSGGGAPTFYPLPVPLPVAPAGARVSIRCRSNSTGIAPFFAIWYYSNFDSDHTSDLHFVATPAAASPVTITPSGVAWTNGNWSQITAGIANSIYLTGLVVLQSNAAAEVEFDIGTGPAASETVFTTVRGPGRISEPRLTYFNLPAPMFVAANTRLSVRMRHNSTSVSTFSAALQYLNNPPPASVPVPANDYPCNMQTPETWGVANVLGSHFLFSPKPLRDDGDYYEGPKFPRQKSMSVINWPSSDWLTGYFPATTFSTSLIDHDHFFRGLGQPSIINAELYQYLISRTTRVTKGNPSLVFRGIIRNDAHSEGQTLDLEAADIVSVDYAYLKEDKLIPQRTMFDDFNFNRDLGVPIIGGTVSITGGAIRVVDGGTITIGGTNYRIAPIACHACKDGIIDAFDSTGTSLNWGTDAWAPGQTGWTTIQPSGALYLDINGRRYTPLLLNLASTICTDFIGGSPIYVNTKGVEASGDGTGAQITDLHLLYRFIFIQFFLLNYQSGAYAATPTFPFYPGSSATIPIVDENTWAAAATSLPGAVVIGAQGRRSSIRDEIAKANVSCNVIMYMNNSSQIAVNRLTTSRSTLLGSTRTITDRRDIYTPPGFKYWPFKDWFFNDHGYQAEENLRDDNAGGWNYFNINGHAPSKAKYGVVTINETYKWIRDHTAADAIGGERLNFAGPDPLRLCSWEQSLCGMGLYLGNGVPITDFRGSGGSGWVNNAVWLTSRWLDIISGRVGFTGVDVQFYVS